MPLATHSVDVAVAVCVLCSVRDPHAVLAEIRRVLRPGGRLLFWEHVRCEMQPALARRQEAASAAEEIKWGCRFDRRSLQAVRAAGFSEVYGSYFELPTNFDLMSPTVLGCAVNAPESGATRAVDHPRAATPSTFPARTSG